jgi:hypothetical protein
MFSVPPESSWATKDRQRISVVAGRRQMIAKAAEGEQKRGVAVQTKGLESA